MSRGLLSLLSLCMLVVFVSAKDSAKSTAQSSQAKPSSPNKHPKALFSTEKKKPSKAEREAVLADSGIPVNQRHNYTAEYRVPVSLGGSNAYANIEILPKSQIPLKHRVQKDLERKLRHGEISENEAQTRILNWNLEPLAKK
jgi:hypothetical protein